MMRRAHLRSGAVVFLAGACTALSLLAHGAHAHGPYDAWGSDEWYSRDEYPYDTLLEMDCDVSVPGTSCGSGFSDQVWEGLRNWNYLAPVEAPASYVMGLRSTWEDDRTWTYCYGAGASDGAITVFHGFIHGSRVLAITGNCLDGDGDIWASSVKFDDSFNWDTDDSVGGNEVDTESVATHEMGHASGVFNAASQAASKRCRGGHWDTKDTSIYVDCTKVEPSLCDGGADDHSMCEAIPTGTTGRRSPEGHDEHSFQVIYGT